MSSPAYHPEAADTPDKQCRHYLGPDIHVGQRYYELDKIEAEDPELYCEGGYYPIHIGDQIGERFKIVHKLGYGGYATVWLAREEDKHRYVALKIIIADKSETYESLDGIASLLDRFPDLFLAELERFFVHSPNGRHLCQVFPVLGPTLDILTDHHHRLYPEYVRDLSLQMVQAIEVMHLNGICHGGTVNPPLGSFYCHGTNIIFPLDLTFRNMALKLSNSLDDLSEEDISAMFPLRKEEITLLPECKAESTRNAPKYAVQSMDFTCLPSDYLSGELVILDFDQAYLTENPTSTLLGLPPRYMAPESIFELKNGPSADVWALGCLIFRMRCGFDLFTDLPETPRNAIMTMYGAISQDLLEHWKLVDFDEYGWPVHEDVEEHASLSKFRIGCSTNCPTLQECIQRAIDPLRPNTTEDNIGILRFCRYLPKSAFKLGHLNEEWTSKNATPIGRDEADWFYDLMSRVFAYDPSKRITAIEMFNHQWFKGEYLPGEGSQIYEQLETGGYATTPAAPAGEDNQEGQDNGPKQEIHSDDELQLQV
ncbi:hypothetical protein MGN70_007893 [Eutypa lata]|nr:hypothetical protein MGN70_007893 [Eutypa lata]